MSNHYYQCSKCHNETNQFSKGARKRRRKGEYAECLACVEAARQAKLKRQEEEYQLRRKQAEERVRKEIQFRLENPLPPPHPEDGKSKSWNPDQTMEIQSGGFCFGLACEAQEAATKPLFSYEQMARATSRKCDGRMQNNVAAKNGEWVAYELPAKPPTCEYYDFGDYVTGWFACHPTVADPLVEVRRMIYHGIAEECGGSLVSLDGSYDTQPHHHDLNMTLLPRYIMGTTYQFSDKEADKVQAEGLYIVDYEAAKGPKSSWKNNAFRGIHTCGDFDVGVLSYDEKGLCHAFLVYGRASDFTHTYFSKEGRTPLGKMAWPPKNDEATPAEAEMIPADGRNSLNEDVIEAEDGSKVRDEGGKKLVPKRTPSQVRKEKEKLYHKCSKCKTKTLDYDETNLKKIMDGEPAQCKSCMAKKCENHRTKAGDTTTKRPEEPMVREEIEASQSKKQKQSVVATKKEGTSQTETNSEKAQTDIRRFFAAVKKK